MQVLAAHAVFTACLPHHCHADTSPLSCCCCCALLVVARLEAAPSGGGISTRGRTRTHTCQPHHPQSRPDEEEEEEPRGNSLGKHGQRSSGRIGYALALLVCLVRGRWCVTWMRFCPLSAPPSSPPADEHDAVSASRSLVLNQQHGYNV